MRKFWVLGGMAALLAGCRSQSDGTSASESGQPSSSPSQTLSALSCPAGSADQPGDPTQPRPALGDRYLLAAMDPTGPRIIVGETGFVPEGAGAASLLTTWAFDVCTNTWTELDHTWPALEERPAVEQLVSDPGAGVVRGIPVWWTPVWAFDPATDSWSAPAAGPPGSEAWPMAVYDTDGERLLAFDPNGLTAAEAQGEPGASGVLTYDVATREWTDVGLADPKSRTPEVLMDQADLAYDSAAQRLILVITRQDSTGQGAQTWALDPVACTWSRGADPPNTLTRGYPSGGWAAAFDPATSRTWWFADSAMLGYDAAADEWVVAERGNGWPESMMLGGVEVDPTARIVSALVADPVNGRLVVIGGSVRPIGDPAGGFVQEDDLMATDDVWAYRPASNTWTMLLAPSNAPASYGPG